MTSTWRHIGALLGSALGFVVLGFLLPVSLFIWNLPVWDFERLVSKMNGSTQDAWLSILRTYVIDGLLWCAPMGILFACLLQARLWVRVLREPAVTFYDLARFGILASVGLTFLNAPAYSIHIDYAMWSDNLGVLKWLLLFVLSGAASGWWTAWQAWRVTHEDAPFWPQVSLKGLLIVVVLLGAMMGVFRPR